MARVHQTAPYRREGQQFGHHFSGCELTAASAQDVPILSPAGLTPTLGLTFCLLERG